MSPDDPPSPDALLADPEAELDRLFASPPTEFVAARDALASQARQAGDRPLAQRIKGLRRPTVAAWVANLLARAEPAPLAELLDLGEALRAAHQNLSAEELRPLAAQRTAVVEALTRRAAALAAEHGRPTTEAVRAEVAGTLQAAMADPAVAEDVRAGRLVRAASYSGFGPAPEPAPASEVVSLEQARTRRRGREQQQAEQARAAAARVAEQRLSTAEDAVITAQAVLSEAEENHLEAAEELDRRSQEVADLRAELAQAEEAEQQAQQTVEQTQQGVSEATSSLAEARTEQEQADQELAALRD